MDDNNSQEQPVQQCNHQSPEPVIEREGEDGIMVDVSGSDSSFYEMSPVPSGEDLDETEDSEDEMQDAPGEDA